MLTMNHIHYTGKYNPHFRPVSNQEIFTVEMSPTGSGKTYFYRDSPNTIMLMPTNALVRQNGGMIASAKALAGERSQWKHLHRHCCDYMTYDKFSGHMQHEDLSDFNIIIDEAHLLIASDKKEHYDLLKALFCRDIAYKELKLISATFRKEVLEMYNSDFPLLVNQYIKDDYLPTIRFTTQLPIINTSMRTLFFINSKDKIIQIKEHFEEKFPSMVIAILSADTEIPDTQELQKCHLILSTCVIKQGYSIECPIDQVIIHNVFNAIGAMDIIQYMARPRINTPEVYVISAKSHFKKSIIEMPDLFSLAQTVIQSPQTKEECKANVSLRIDELLARAKNVSTVWNPLGVANFYESQMTLYELFDNDGRMEASIHSIIPSAKVIIADVTQSMKIRFTKLNIKKLQATLAENENVTILKQILKQILEEGDSSEYDDRTKQRIKEWLKVEPIAYFEKGRNKYRVYPYMQVKQVLYPEILKQFKQHKDNIQKGVYDIRDSHDPRYLPSVGESYPVSKIPRKLEFITHKFKKGINSLELLSKIYSIKLFAGKDEVDIRSKKTITHVEIISKYPILDEWYHETNEFMIFDPKKI